MHNITALALTFTVCLATTIVVAALFRVAGRQKSSLLDIIAIPVGVILA